MVNYNFRGRILKEFYGSYKALSKSLGYSRSHVSRVIRGKRDMSQEIKNMINKRWYYLKEKYGGYITRKETREIDGEKYRVFKRSGLFEWKDEEFTEEIKKEQEQYMKEQGGYTMEELKKEGGQIVEGSVSFDIGFSKYGD